MGGRRKSLACAAIVVLLAVPGTARAETQLEFVLPDDWVRLAPGTPEWDSLPAEARDASAFLAYDPSTVSSGFTTNMHAKKIPGAPVGVDELADEFRSMFLGSSIVDKKRFDVNHVTVGRVRLNRQVSGVAIQHVVYIVPGGPECGCITFTVRQDAAETSLADLDKAALATKGIREPTSSSFDRLFLEPWFRSTVAFTLIGVVGGLVSGLKNRRARRHAGSPGVPSATFGGGAAPAPPRESTVPAAPAPRAPPRPPATLSSSTAVIIAVAAVGALAVWTWFTLARGPTPRASSATISTFSTPVAPPATPPSPPKKAPPPPAVPPPVAPSETPPTPTATPSTPAEPRWQQFDDAGFGVFLPCSRVDTSDERLHVTTRKRQTLRLQCRAVEVTLENPSRTYWAATVELMPDMGAPDEVLSLIQGALAERWKAERAEPKVVPGTSVRVASSDTADGKGRLHLRMSRAGSRLRIVAAVVAATGDAPAEAKRFLDSLPQ